jgi:TonB-linked SusC/RagA family outer membrane protein
MRKLLATLVAVAICITAALAQTHQLTGKVTDDKGDPVAYASIKIKSSKTGTAADGNGNFKINVKDNDILVISGTGMVLKEVPVSGSTSLSIILNAGNNELSSVVVTALGIKRETKTLGYSTAKIDSKDINSSAPLNVANGVTGKVSGAIIQLTNSGVDPDNIRITLRGNRSFLGNNEALVIVDNVPADNSFLAQLNPNDVESYNVLKGATAAALYGSQAANGVIVVTTKQGQRGRASVTYNTAVTLDRVSFLPKMETDHGGASSEYLYTDAISFSNQSNFQNGYVPFENQSFSTPFAQGSPYGGDSVVIGFPTATGRIQKVAYKALPNELMKFFKTGVTLQNGVSYSSGDEVSNFYLSAQNVSRTGVTPKDTYNRTNVRANGSKKYGVFKASANVSYSQSNVNEVGSNNNFYTQIQNIAPQVPFASYSNTNADFADINTYYNAYALNPYWYIDNQRYKYTRNDLIGNMDLSLDATKWLNIDYVAGINNEYFLSQSTTAAINFSPYASNFLASLESADEAFFVGNQLPHVSNVADNVYKLYSNVKVTFHKHFGDFGTQLILGNVINQYRENYLSNASTTLLNIGGFYNVNYREGIPGVDQEYYTSRNYGNFADLTLNYKEFIYLHGSARSDNTSLLNPQYRRYFYPAGDISVILSDAIDALKNIPSLSFLKISASLTKVGNISVNPFQIQNVFGAGPGFPFGQLGGLTSSSTFSYPNLKPEFTVSHEFGGEIGLLQSRIDFKANYYSEKTTNETVPVNISATSGYQNALVNVGEMDNKGLEMDLMVTPLKMANGLRWDIGFHYTHFINKVVSLGAVNSLYIANTLGTSNSYAVVGLPYATLRLQDWARDSATGKVIVDGNTGLPSKAPDLVNFGTTNPTQTLGINTTITFKGFTLAAVVEYWGGNVIYNGTGVTLEEDGLSSRTSTFGLQRFVYPNSVIIQNGKAVPNTNVTINDGGVGFWGNFGFFPPSMYVTSASFWSLRNASISYDLPAKLLSKSGFIKKLTIGIVGSNLILLLPKLNTWTDPEFSEDTGNATGTNSLNETPPTRTFGANLTITF